MRAAAVLVAVAACHSHPAPPPQPPPSGFGYYLLAMMWAPPCPHQLTLHGLWPNYTEDQARGQPRAWPQFCGAYAHCEQTEDASCAPGARVPDELAALAPAYALGSGSFATHEWSKHGSCTTLSAGDFFAAELAAIHSLPGNGTPDALRAAAGHDLARSELQRAFGIPPESVVLGCDDHCRFTQVGFCLAKDAGDHPTTPTPCTASVTTSEYDNGCATRGCERVAIPGC
jgi:ribonuclease T2